MTAFPILLIGVILIVLVAIWLIEAAQEGCKLHDWQPERGGGLRCAKCQRMPDAE